MVILRIDGVRPLLGSVMHRYVAPYTARAYRSRMTTSRPPSASDVPRLPRSRRRVFGSLLLTVLVAFAAVAGCVALYAGSTPARTLEVRRDELAAGVPKFTPLTRLGAAGTRTHGVWLIIQPDGNAVALSSRGPDASCFIEWRAEAATASGRGAFRDGCTGVLFGLGGEPTDTNSARGMDRYTVTRAGTMMRVELEHMTFGNCGRSIEQCSKPGAPMMQRGY